MSIRLMARVFDRPRPTVAQQIVMLALADNANDDGECWPGLDEIARKCCLSRQGVVDQIKALEAAGCVVVVRASGRVNHYRIPVTQGDPSPKVTRNSSSPVNQVDPSSGLTRQPGVLVPVNPVDPHPSTRLTPPVNPVDPNHQEPSSQPSGEPSAIPSPSVIGLETLCQAAQLQAWLPGRAAVRDHINGALAAGVPAGDIYKAILANRGATVWAVLDPMKPKPTTASQGAKRNIGMTYQQLKALETKLRDNGQ